MSVKTVDLFDEIEENDIQLRPQITVNVDRIEELTMHKINGNRVDVFNGEADRMPDIRIKTVHSSIRRVILIAATLICFFTLCCCVAAATLGTGDFFKDYFGFRQKNSLSKEQNEYIDKRTAAIGESVVQDGVTVVINGAVSDGTTAYIVVDIIAPDNQNIESLPLGFNVEFDKLKLDGQEKDHISSVATACIPVSDSDGKVNTAKMLIQYNVYQFQGSNFSLADGKKRTLQLRNLFYHKKEYPYSLCTVAEGLWEFEFAFTKAENKTTELLEESISASYVQISGNRVDAEITSIEIKGLSAVVYYVLDTNEVQESGDFGVLRFVMKDGVIINAYPEKAGQTAQIYNGELIAGSESNYCAYVFDAPVNYEDIVALYIDEVEILF